MGDRSSYEVALTRVSDHFSECSWWDEEAFFNIWEKMHEKMPLALKPGPDGIVYPAVEMIAAANEAGYNLPYKANLEFGIYIRTVLTDYYREIRLLVYEAE